MKTTTDRGPCIRSLRFTPEERALITKACNLEYGKTLVRPVFYHDAIIKEAKRLVEEAENGQGIIDRSERQPESDGTGTEQVN